MSTQGFSNLLGRIDRLASLRPIAISVTWGAGGSTKERSLDLAGFTQSEYCVETILHLTCTNMEGGMIDDALKVFQCNICENHLISNKFPQGAKERGIQNILALRGGMSLILFQVPLQTVAFKMPPVGPNTGYRQTHGLFMLKTWYRTFGRPPSTPLIFVSE